MPRSVNALAERAHLASSPTHHSPPTPRGSAVCMSVPPRVPAVNLGPLIPASSTRRRLADEHYQERDESDEQYGGQRTRERE
jgi:hypothetical protein